MTLPQKPKILLVDDKKANLVALERALRSFDIEIFKALSGNQALTLVLEHNFALILLDVQMPEMDGLETASLMKENEETKDIPIIFVTAISKEEKYVRKGYEIGAFDYIFKPINLDILESKIAVFANLNQKILTLGEECKKLEEKCRQLEIENKKLKDLKTNLKS